MENKHKHADGVECDSCRLGAEEFKNQQRELIEKHGWLSHAVPDDPDVPFGLNVHTHGLEENFSHTDLQICLPAHPNTCHHILIVVIDRIRAGEKFVAGKRYSDIIVKYDVLFLEAEECGRKVLRLICPDDKGSFASDLATEQMNGCMIPEGIILN